MAGAAFMGGEHEEDEYEQEDEAFGQNLDYSESLPGIKNWEALVASQEFQLFDINGVPDIHYAYTAYLEFETGNSNAYIIKTKYFDDFNQFTIFWDELTNEEKIDKFIGWKSVNN